MPASPSTARAINDRLALRLLQEEGPLTAGQLKQLTGLSRPTVADLVERLTVSGLITVVGEAGEQRRGPNARLYGIVADRAHLAALDVRTESVRVVVTDLVGRVLAEASVPIGGDTGTGPVVEQAVALVEGAAKEAGATGAPARDAGRAWGRLHTVGIGAPGLIDPTTGELRDSSGLPEWHRRLVAAVQDRFPEAHVNVGNEANLAALAEQRDGAAHDRDTFVLLWLSHGTGAAVVLDGALRRGASGGTGEIGFLPVPGTIGLPSATDCAGGFHSLAGSAAIVELAREYGLPAEDAAERPAAAGVVRAAVDLVGRGAWGAEADPGRGEAAGSLGRGDVGSVRSEDAGSVGGGRAAQGGGEDAGPAGMGEASSARSGDASSVGGERAVQDRGEDVGWARRERDGSAGGERAVRDRGADAGPAGRGDVGSARSGGAGSARGERAVQDCNQDAGPVGSGHADPPSGERTAQNPARIEVAGRFLDALADRLAVGVASVVAILDPGCVVLGGEVGQAGGKELARRVEDRVRRMSPLATEVRPSTLGGAAVLRGALLTARDQAQDELFAPPER
ncbi:ROK family protein [Streptomyces sp. VMFN-G11Ma]|uniref:ROK family protein n=1 Tax=Streptomyces sp. VMFN-G11Ma TaxID=2135609 RepID=UPI000D3BABA7|nr:ROK family protein [Streptomyces sp. VMFN-G11Ma]PTM94537.1 putative NBD/HSP70 family sugar kinase [Streptomyces sp. VMFN-G11Ma]